MRKENHCDKRLSKNRRGEENFVDREALIENFPFFATRNSLARAPLPQIVLQKAPNTVKADENLYIYTETRKS